MSSETIAAQKANGHHGQFGAFERSELVGVELDVPAQYSEMVIPVERWGALLARIDKLNHRADKLGVDQQISVVEVERTLAPVDGSGSGLVEVVRIHVSGMAPKIDGWAVAAVVDMTSEVPLVHSVGGEELPRDAIGDGECDHCHQRRARSKLVVLRDENGNLKRVGTTCLGDFMTRDGAGVASWYTDLAELEDELEEGGQSGCVATHAPPEYVMAWTIAAVANLGWHKRSDTDPTADLVEAVMFGSPRSMEEAMDRIGALTPEQLAEAERAVEWLKGLSGSEWAENVAAVFNGEAVRRKHLGIACSGIVAWNRHNAEQVEAEASTSGWVGKPKERIRSHVLTIKSVRVHETAYGIKMNVTAVDAEGNLVWLNAAGSSKFAAALGDSPEGSVISVDATVKDHATSRSGIKATVLERATIVADPTVVDDPNAHSFYAGMRSSGISDDDLKDVSKRKVRLDPYRRLRSNGFNHEDSMSIAKSDMEPEARQAIERGATIEEAVAVASEFAKDQDSMTVYLDHLQKGAPSDVAVDMARRGMSVYQLASAGSVETLTELLDMGVDPIHFQHTLQGSMDNARVFAGLNEAGQKVYGDSSRFAPKSTHEARMVAVSLGEPGIHYPALVVDGVPPQVAEEACRHNVGDVYRQFRAAGVSDIEDIVRLRDSGIGTGQTRQLGELLGRGASLDDAAKVVVAFRAAYGHRAFEEFSAHEIVGMLDGGIAPEFINKARDLTVAQVEQVNKTYEGDLVAADTVSAMSSRYPFDIACDSGAYRTSPTLQSNYCDLRVEGLDDETAAAFARTTSLRFQRHGHARALADIAKVLTADEFLSLNQYGPRRDFFEMVRDGADVREAYAQVTQS